MRKRNHLSHTLAYSPLLQDLGLTQNEAEVYELLLKLGESPLADLEQATGAHSQTLYRALDGLAERGLVLVTTRRFRRYYRAEDPVVLEHKERERLSAVKQALPGLQALTSTSKDAIVRVSKGNEAVRSLRFKALDELKRGEVYYILSGSGQRYYEVMGPQFREEQRQRIHRGIVRRLIAFESQRTPLAQRDKFRQLSHFRFLPEHFPVPSSTNIYHDTVAIVVWSAEPIVITIESPEVAQSYRQQFESLWKIAKS